MRFPSLEPERMSPAQKRVHDAIASGPRGGVRGPFGVLLRSPELADRVQKVGEHLRFNSSLPARLNELAILINARFWGSKYEWYAHRPFAIKGGLAESIADDLAQNRRPVDDAVFGQAVALLGEQGVVDLIGVSGYYTLVSMVLNVADIPLPAGAPSPW